MQIRIFMKAFTIFFVGWKNTHSKSGRPTLPKRILARKLSSSQSDEEEVVKSMLHRIRQVNKMTQEIKMASTTFEVDDVMLGQVMPSNLAKLLESPIFEMTEKDTLTLSSQAGNTCSSRTEAVKSVMEDLRDRGDVPGWRDELLPVSSSFYDNPVFLMERAAIPILGALEYGVHLNGLVQRPNEREFMWLARRSATKSKYPGFLDHIVAGGQPAGLTLMENVVKECLEEAGIPNELVVEGINPAGAISYETYIEERQCISRVVLFCYDLWLPSSFEPTPVDGEVSEFFLWNVDQVKETFHPKYGDPIKPNCYLVIADYLLRKGHISPEIPGYLDALRELRNGDCR